MRAIPKHHPLRAAKRKHGELTVAFLVTGHTSVKRLHRLAGSLPKPQLAALLASVDLTSDIDLAPSNQKRKWVPR